MLLVYVPQISIKLLANPDYDSKPSSVTAGSPLLEAATQCWVTQQILEPRWPSKDIFFLFLCHTQLSEVFRKQWSPAKVLRCKQLEGAWVFLLSMSVQPLNIAILKGNILLPPHMSSSSLRERERFAIYVSALQPQHFEGQYFLSTGVL